MRRYFRLPFPPKDRESPEEGVIREVMEETGYRAGVERLVGIYSAPFKSDLVISFACTILGRANWVPNEEIVHVGFFLLNELPTPIKNNTRVRIADASEGKIGVCRTFRIEEHG
ncbi:NUDIX domain-containing protein [Glaciimonas immobilis]|uniref:8-oxo-dGTP pyrophosphatase MutT (NUDIX family) n=1 Tax=Glaciimonas immobilis TaxID=728004 RepID=A0A840RU04_9BURK|nr:NUDIX domain-containing protein [Glaciimonas immobilis]KAF3999896.1 NUDIX domain-containing protein [Glaciimonas immobilis]MBB5200386.1 8-oxo-dGTP pyrophosphatase MutT (NUDIX family) [Glaciimonas immobilis]